MRMLWLPVILLVAIASAVCAAGAGFTSRQHLEEHYRKHGSEFGQITKAEYLRLAQELRDVPVGGPVLEIKRADGAVTRFDRRKGYFGAYNADGSIRTFFIPAAGESYFRRQARR